MSAENNSFASSLPVKLGLHQSRWSWQQGSRRGREGCAVSLFAAGTTSDTSTHALLVVHRDTIDIAVRLNSVQRLNPIKSSHLHMHYYGELGVINVIRVANRDMLRGESEFGLLSHGPRTPWQNSVELENYGDVNALALNMIRWLDAVNRTALRPIGGYVLSNLMNYLRHTTSTTW